MIHTYIDHAALFIDDLANNDDSSDNDDLSNYDDSNVAELVNEFVGWSNIIGINVNDQFTGILDDNLGDFEKTDEFGDYILHDRMFQTAWTQLKNITKYILRRCNEFSIDDDCAI